MRIKDTVAVVTGAGSGIGLATAQMLVKQGVYRVALVDVSPGVRDIADEFNQVARREVALPFVGDTTDGRFRETVFDEMEAETGTQVTICVPAAGITRDGFAVKRDNRTGAVNLYSQDAFRLVLSTNLEAPVYWSMEMARRIVAKQDRDEIAWDPAKGFMATAVFVGSVSSEGNSGQLSYSIAKQGLVAAMEVLNREGQRNSIRCVIIHPGFTDTPMVRKMPPEAIRRVLERTKLGRLITVEEVAEGIRFLIENDAANRELWLCGGIRLAT